MHGNRGRGPPDQLREPHRHHPAVKADRRGGVPTRNRGERAALERRSLRRTLGCRKTAEAGRHRAVLAWRARSIPVQTVGVGQERCARDLGIERVVLPPSALVGAGVVLEAGISVRGLNGRQTTVTVAPRSGRSRPF